MTLTNTRSWYENNILFFSTIFCIALPLPVSFESCSPSFLPLLLSNSAFTWNFSQNYIESYNFLSMKKHWFPLLRIREEVLYICSSGKFSLRFSSTLTRDSVSVSVINIGKCVVCARYGNHIDVIFGVLYSIYCRETYTFRKYAFHMMSSFLYASSPMCLYDHTSLAVQLPLPFFLFF